MKTFRAYPRRDLGIIPWSKWIDQKSHMRSADCRQRMHYIIQDHITAFAFYLRIVVADSKRARSQKFVHIYMEVSERSTITNRGKH